MGFKLSTARKALQASLLDSAAIFGESTAQQEQFDLHLKSAVADFNRVAPLALSDSLTLLDKVNLYPAPANAIKFRQTPLVRDQQKLVPWDPRRVEEVPTPIITRVAGVKNWDFSPTPTTAMLFLLGSTYPYSYISAHQLKEDETQTTILDEHLPLLVMRAQVESLRALAIRNAGKPVVMRDAGSSTTRNGTPAALAEQVYRMWEQQIREGVEIYGTLRLTTGR